MKYPLLAALCGVLALTACDGGRNAEPASARDTAAAEGEAPVSELQVLTLVSNTDGFGEPSLGVTPEGVIFTNLGSLVYRSKDGGHTWENVGDPAPLYPNNDPDLAVDLDGNIWESRLYALICNEVSVSQDLGESWSTFPAVCNLPVGDRQYVVPTKDCEAFLYWHQVPSFHQTVMHTSDCGATWLPTNFAESLDHHLLINEGSTWGGGGFYNPVTDSVFLTYTRAVGSIPEGVVGLINDRPHPGYSVSYDDFNWTEGVGPEMHGIQLGLGLVTGAADKAGNVYLTWGEYVNGLGVEVYVAKSSDDGRSWGEKIRVDKGIGSRVFPMIAAGDDGRVAVAYYKSEEPGFPDDASQWTVELSILDLRDPAAEKPVVHRLSLTDGRVIKQTPICISGTTCAGGREFLDYFALKAMPDGTVIATYNELTEDDQLRNWFARTKEAFLKAD
ncbi:MAG: sialidase family protein [Oceanococcaceae bacterium]